MVKLHIYTVRERKREREREREREIQSLGWLVGWLVGFYDISTITGYLMPDPVYKYLLNMLFVND